VAPSLVHSAVGDTQSRVSVPSSSCPAAAPLAGSPSHVDEWRCFGVPFPEPDEVGSSDRGQAPASGGGDPELLGCSEVAQRWGARATKRDLTSDGLRSDVVTR
jgi:hypothetical protein